MIKKIVFFTLIVGFGSDLALAMINSESEPLIGDAPFDGKKAEKELRKQEKIAQKAKEKREKEERDEKKKLEKMGKRSLKNIKKDYEPLGIEPAEQAAKPIDENPVVNVESFDVIGKGDNVCVKKNKIGEFFKELNEKKRIKRIKVRLIKRSDIVDLPENEMHQKEVLPDEKAQILALLNQEKKAQADLEKQAIVERHEELAPVMEPEVPNIVHAIKHNKFWACSIVTVSVVGGGSLLWIFREKVCDKIKSWFGHPSKEITAKDFE